MGGEVLDRGGIARLCDGDAIAQGHLSSTVVPPRSMVRISPFVFSSVRCRGTLIKQECLKLEN